jgi:hypothetical protein
MSEFHKINKMEVKCREFIYWGEIKVFHLPRIIKCEKVTDSQTYGRWTPSHGKSLHDPLSYVSYKDLITD